MTPGLHGGFLAISQTLKVVVLVAAHQLSPDPVGNRVGRVTLTRCESFLQRFTLPVVHYQITASRSRLVNLCMKPVSHHSFGRFGGFLRRARISQRHMSLSAYRSHCSHCPHSSVGRKPSSTATPGRWDPLDGDGLGSRHNPHR